MTAGLAHDTVIEAHNYINGKWIPAQNGATFESYSPVDGRVLGRLAKSSKEDVDVAVTAARKAFASWRKMPAPRRGEILFKVAQLIADRKEKIAHLMTQEMGKVIAEARGDVQEGVDMAYYMGGEGRRQFGLTAPSEMFNKFQMAIREPVGVVAAITPWNFPFAIPTWKIMPALVCGNTVVFKPATDTPLVAVELVKIFEEAGLPAGVLNLVLGTGSEAGEALLQHPEVDIYTFTGSTDSGKHIYSQTAGKLKRVSLELGGKNAIMVMEDADLDLATEGIIWSAFGTSGQRCTAASRVIAHRAIEKQLTEKLVERASKLRLGNGALDTTDVGPVINRSQRNNIHEYTKIGLEEGANLLTGGRVAEEGDLAKGAFYYPTLFNKVRPNMRIAQEEIFGPTTVIIGVDSLEEAIEINNGVPFGLSASLYTSNVNKAFAAMREVQNGLFYINHGTIGAEAHMPFGGMKQTGNGHREAAWAAIDFFTEWKAVYVDYSGKLQRAQIDE